MQIIKILVLLLISMIVTFAYITYQPKEAFNKYYEQMLLPLINKGDSQEHVIKVLDEKRIVYSYREKNHNQRECYYAVLYDKPDNMGVKNRIDLLIFLDQNKNVDSIKIRTTGYIFVLPAFILGNAIFVTTLVLIIFIVINATKYFMRLRRRQITKLL